jgi:hypothetical protein
MTLKLSDLTHSQLAELSRLIAMKEKVKAKYDVIVAKIDAFDGDGVQNGIKAAKPPQKRAGRRGPKRGSKPGRTKEMILAALHAAGTEGLTLKEISHKLKVKTNKLYSWFYTTGKKVAGLKKSGEGKYTYSVSAKK